jgi:hypothetical protein
MVANIAVTEFTTSAVAVWLLQKLKTATWFPLVQQGRAWLNRAASIVLAGVGAVGVSYTWAPNPMGGHMLTVAIPTLSVAALGAWHWLNHFVMQETIYQATSNGKPANGAAPIAAPAAQPAK